MTDVFARRRYLLNFDTSRLGQVFTDVLIIGSGVAGLRAAIAAAEQADVIVVTKDRVPDCNTAYAQGGVAVVTDAADSFEANVEDTLQVGCGLGNTEAIELMAKEAPQCLAELMSWGAHFDRHNGAVALGMEGGHSARRVVHAQGDATGRELSNTLWRRASESEKIRIFEHCFVIDLVVEEGRCIAALTYHEKYGHQIIWASQTILAAGGAGCLFRETTNAPTATADGHAIAFRAGAKVRDMEFFQFHPTALYVAGAARALISEAVRGEGGRLVDREGHRFMKSYHPDAELAPRDVVSRAILRHMAATSATCAFLDVRHFPPGRFRERFPNIAALCQDFDIDVSRSLIPIRPAAHYMIGGVIVDNNGRSSVANLLACGEVASTGVHGANRLASNSLLEGLVFGKRVGRLAAEAAGAPGNAVHPRHLKHTVTIAPRTELDLPDVRNSLRAVCWRNVGIERTGDRLAESVEIIDFWGRYVMDKVLTHRMGWETQNMLTVARLMAQAAVARKESRGTHYRGDFPATDDEHFLGHIAMQKLPEEIRQTYEPLRKSG